MADRSTTYGELKKWLWDLFSDPFYYFWKQKSKPTYWLLTFTPTLLFYLATTVGVVGAAFWKLGQWAPFGGPNVLKILWAIGDFTTSIGGYIANLPVLGPVFGACFVGLKTVFGPLLAALGLGSNPIGWGLTAILALPAIAGGVYEAGARLKNCFHKEDDFVRNAIRILFAPISLPISLPINFLYGFCRTAYHLITGKGYLGSIKEAAKNIDDDVLRARNDAQSGGGSIFGCLVPPVVDRVIGLVVGIVAGVFNFFRSIFFHQSNIGWAILSTLGGMWRGIWSGSNAAFDAYNYYGPNPETPISPVSTVAPKIDDSEFDSKLSSYASTIKNMSMNQGYTATSSRYWAAKTIAEMAVLRQRYARSDSDEEKSEVRREFENVKAISKFKMR